MIEQLIIYTIEEAMKRSRPDEERMLLCFDLSSFSYTCMGTI